jgi:prepilin-type N-terminal cleavage/methylation domain-containing protein
VKRPIQKRKGYTLIEVLMALAILTAGAVGIMALQQAATRGNMEARQMTTATVVAQRWVERLRRDNLNWTAASNTHNVIALAGTSYLRNVTLPGNAPVWFVPTPPALSGEAASFDFYGQDTTDGGQMHYCTQLRLEWIYPGRAMRADVRVWWSRRAQGTDRNIGIGAADRYANCGAAVSPDTLTNDFNARMVYTTTVLRYTPLPRVR